MVGKQLSPKAVVGTYSITQENRTMTGFLEGRVNSVGFAFLVAADERQRRPTTRVVGFLTRPEKPNEARVQ